MDDKFIAALTSGSLVEGLFVFFLFYGPLWDATTREPLPAILRRNPRRFNIFIMCGVAAAGGLSVPAVHFRDWSAWPYYT